MSARQSWYRNSSWTPALVAALRSDIRTLQIAPPHDEVVLSLLQWAFERRFDEPVLGKGQMRLVLTHRQIGSVSPISIWNSGSGSNVRHPVIQIHFGTDKRFEKNEEFRVGLAFVTPQRLETLRSRLNEITAIAPLADTDAPEIRLDALAGTGLQEVLAALDRTLFRSAKQPA